MGEIFTNAWITKICLNQTVWIQKGSTPKLYENNVMQFRQLSRAWEMNVIFLTHGDIWQRHEV